MLIPRYRFIGVLAIVGSIGVLALLPDYLGRELNSFDDVQDTLERNYDSIVRAGGSAIEYTEVQIPVLSGAVALFLRPFPWEIRSSAMLATTIEIYILTLLLLVIVLRWYGRLMLQILKRPEILMPVLVCLLFAFMYTYMGNLGLLARQRLQAMPAILLLIGMAVAMNRARQYSSKPSPYDTFDRDRP